VVVFHNKHGDAGTDPEIDLRGLVKAALAAGKSVKFTVVEISGDGGNVPVHGEDLTACQEHCIEVLREAGHRLTQSQILASLAKHGYHDAESTVKLALAQMSRDGRLTKDPDGNPRGYGLPEWNEKENNKMSWK
jgi:hypothetical protein